MKGSYSTILSMYDDVLHTVEVKATTHYKITDLYDVKYLGKMVTTYKPNQNKKTMMVLFIILPGRHKHTGYLILTENTKFYILFTFVMRN